MKVLEHFYFDILKLTLQPSRVHPLRIVPFWQSNVGCPAVIYWRSSPLRPRDYPGRDDRSWLFSANPPLFCRARYCLPQCSYYRRSRNFEPNAVSQRFNRSVNIIGGTPRRLHVDAGSNRVVAEASQNPLALMDKLQVDATGRILVIKEKPFFGHLRMFEDVLQHS